MGKRKKEKYSRESVHKLVKRKRNRLLRDTLSHKKTVKLNSKIKERTAGDDYVRSNDSGRDSVDGRECGGTVTSNLNECSSARIEVAEKCRRM